jgi:hypothetical protein
MRTRPGERGRKEIPQADFYRIHLLVISFLVTDNPRASSTTPFTIDSYIKLALIRLALIT